MFEDRFEAAEQLVPYLSKYMSNQQSIILAIPRGGLQLASVLAKRLKLPLDVVFVKKIGAPGNPEAAIGAVSVEHFFLDNRYATIPGIQEYASQQAEIIRSLLNKRVQNYRAQQPQQTIKGKNVIIVDDGVATGSTLLATIELIKQQKPARIIVALPVSPQDTLEKIKAVADEVICLLAPQDFKGVGQFYKQFDQVSDEQAIELLKQAQK